MAPRSNTTVTRVLVFIFLGLIIGGILGESLGLLLGQIGEMTHSGANNIVRNFFVQSWPLSFGLGMEGDPITIDLYLLKFKFGFALKFNVVSLVGLAVSLYIMKWTGDR